VYPAYGEMANEDIIHRMNYGIVFRPTVTVQFTDEYWFHTYEISLPAPMHLRPTFGCHNDNATCHVVNLIQANLNAIKTRTATVLNLTMAQIKGLLPESTPPAKQRSKRALFSFIGTFSKNLFGTATTNDVNMLAQHINALTKKNLRIANTLTRFSSHFSSYMTSVDERFRNALDGIRLNHEVIRQTSMTIEANYNSLKEAFISLSSILTHQIEQSATIEHKLEELKLGIHSLVKGKVSPLLIAPNVLMQTCHHIQKLLNNHYAGFTLLRTNPNFYYQHGKFVFARTKFNKLYITLKFPVMSSKRTFKLFHITSYPVPINESSKEATQLLDLSPHIAVSDDTQYSAVITNTQFAQCYGNTFYHCPFQPTLISLATPSCEVALFQNNKQEIKQLCNFRFLAHSQTSRLISLTAQTLLVYNTPLISLTCPSGQSMIKGCSMCMINVPCLCSVTSQKLLIPARLGKCQDKTISNVTYAHPVNLALIQHFFEDDPLDSISGDTLYPSPIRVKLPDFHIYSHKFNKIVANDQQDHLSLGRIVKSVKKDNQVFRTLTDSLLEGQIQIPTSTFNINFWITTGSLGLSMLCLTGIIWLFYKYKALTAALSLVLQAAPVKSELPSFEYHVTTQAPNTSYTVFMTTFIEHLPTLLQFVNLAFIIICIYQLSKKKSRCTTLSLELSSGSICELIPFLSLSLCPSHWHINQQSPIYGISIEGYLYPKLCVEWPEFVIQNKMTGQCINVPKTIKISYFMARRIRKILTHFQATVYMSHHGLYSVLLPNEQFVNT
jgi:hypothetical protein